jgi:hypothetical protein
MPVQRRPSLGKLNAFKDFPDKKVSLKRCQILGDEGRINSQTKHCLSVGGRFGFNHDLGKHRSSSALRRCI